MKVLETIGVDADDTLFDENGAVRAFINETYGLAHTEEHYLVPGEYWGYWEGRWGVDEGTAAEWYANLISSGVKHRLQPKPGALEGLTEMKKSVGLVPVIITSRSLDLRESTHDAFHNNFPDLIGRIEFVEDWKRRGVETKAGILHAIGAIGLVDDSVEHSRGVLRAGLVPNLFGWYGWSVGAADRASLNPTLDWEETVKFWHARRAA